ncbi:MAG TPA: DUF4287 domain-containing protein [Pedobacter sp.]|jgi:hypothetical protein
MRKSGNSYFNKNLNLYHTSCQFQEYLNTIKEKTGKSPQDFNSLAEEKGFTQNGKLKVKAGEIVKWLKDEFELGHGHSMAIFALLKGSKNEDSI